MKVIQPQIDRDLEEAKNFKALLVDDETVYSKSLVGEDISGVDVRSFSGNSLRFERLDATESKLIRTGLVDVAFLNCSLIATNMAESSWRRVLLTESRCSGLQLHGTTLKDVSFIACKLDLANFRFAKLKNVTFIDCILDEADFYSAELERVTFEGCSLSKSQFSGSKLKKVDLRGSDISEILGMNSLSGATISNLQLMSIAPVLANELKIVVED